MAGEPTNATILEVLREVHGDVRVALDRTQNLSKIAENLDKRVTDHGLDLARAKGSASVFGSIASVVVVGVIEGCKAILGAKS